MSRNRRGSKPQKEELTNTQEYTRERGNSKPSRGRKGSPKGKDSLKDPKQSGNDPAWYAADPALLRDAASYPFSFNTGATEIHDPALWSGAAFVTGPETQIPGLCSLKVHPVIGTATEATDPINVASQSVYSFVRHANSGHSNYDAPDLMIYILAMSNMYSFLVWCQRLYGYALTYNQRNRYLPNDLIRTNGVDVQDLVNNLANFRFWIDTLAAKMSSFAVPATMSVFSRMTFLFSDFYVEGTSIKEQLYQYVPEGWYKFMLDSDQKGKLHWEQWLSSSPKAVSDIMTYGEDLFNAIWSQEDFGIMSGDILKAYGDRIIKVAAIPEFYTIDPKFDAMVLTQMKNADIVRVDASDIGQTNTGLISQILVPKTWTTSDKYYGTSASLAANAVVKANNAMNAIINDYNVLTVDTDQPTPEVVIEASRLKVGYNKTKLWYVAGTEVITGVTLTVQPSVDITLDQMLFVSYNVVPSGSNIPKEQAVEKSRHFHYLPKFYVGNYASDADKIAVIEHFDIDNFTVLTYQDILKLHEAATINMFAVPSIGKVM